MVEEFYRERLKSELDRRCRNNPRYSLRAFAKALETDVATLSRTINGKMTPSRRMSEKWVEHLDLIPEEQEQFLNSVRDERFAKRPSSSSTSSQSPAFSEIDAKLFRVICDWYHYAILELTYCPDFTEDPSRLAKRLDISQTQAKLAIERLISLGMIRKTKKGWEKTQKNITIKDKLKTSTAHRALQKQVLLKAVESLENDPLSSRVMMSTTLAADPSKMEGARQRIQRFMRQLSRYLETGKDKRVHHIGICLYPVSDKDSV